MVIVIARAGVCAVVIRLEIGLGVEFLSPREIGEVRFQLDDGRRGVVLAHDDGDRDRGDVAQLVHHPDGEVVNAGRTVAEILGRNADPVGDVALQAVAGNHPAAQGDGVADVVDQRLKDGDPGGLIVGIYHGPRRGGGIFRRIENDVPHPGGVRPGELAHAVDQDGARDVAVAVIRRGDAAQQGLVAVGGADGDDVGVHPDLGRDHILVKLGIIDRQGKRQNRQRRGNAQNGFQRSHGTSRSSGQPVTRAIG